MKRILSILLAALMVVSIFVMPTSAADDSTTTYSWNGFAANDFRTNKASEGQVIDLGIKGPVASAPVVDGMIDTGEYNKVATLTRLDKANSVEAAISTHDGYLYIAVDVSELVGLDRTAVQFDIGVGAGPTSEQAYTRIGFSINAAGKLQETRSPFVTVTGESVYATGVTSVTLADFIVDIGFDAGVHEIKVDLGRLYRYFANMPGCVEAWENPTVNFTFWDLSNGSNHYSIDSKTNGVAYQNVGRAVSWLPYTIILPEDTMQYLYDNQRGLVGELGKDWRNLVEGQMLRVDEYATTAPTIDGVVEDNEYTDSYVINHTYQTTTYGAVNASFSVKDGWVYGALSYDEAEPKAAHLQMGLNTNTGTMVWGRLSGVINTNGTYTGPGGMYKDIDYTWEGKGENGANLTNQWVSGQYNGVGLKACQPVDASAFKNVDGVTTIEFRASIAAMASAVEESGWCASEANVFKLMFWPGQVDMLGWKTTTDTLATVRPYSGWNADPGYVCPTVALPYGCVDKYKVNDVDDMGAYGQLQAVADAGTVTFDGKIGAGEYTASASWDGLRSADGLANPDIFSHSGTNYFTYDESYFYFGAKVVDPNYVSGKSAFQLNLQVINNKDGKVDLGDGVTRINMMAYVRDDGTTTVGKYGWILRSQTCYNTGNAETAYAGQAEWGATFSHLGPEVAGSYDANTKTITYEFKIPMDHLKLIFGVDSVEKVGFLHYVQYADASASNATKGAWNLFKAPDNAALRAIWAGTRAVAGSTSMKYQNNFFMHFVNLGNDPTTKDSASVRLSSSVSGLRFKTVYTNKYLDMMADYAASIGETMTIGTLIAPKDYVDAAGACTHEALYAKYGAKGYVDVSASTATPFSNANGVTVIAGSLVNIKEGNLGRDFAGIGYIKVGNDYFYTDSYAVKNVSDVATNALADTSNAQQNVYKYEVSAGVWSPYTEGQRLILQNLVA